MYKKISCNADNVGGSVSLGIPTAQNVDENVKDKLIGSGKDAITEKPLNAEVYPNAFVLEKWRLRLQKP